MAYSLTCADMGTDCPRQVVTENEDELPEHVSCTPSGPTRRWSATRRRRR